MKIAVITGASRGIGLATAKKFLTEGWRVVGTFNKTEPPIKDDNFTPINLDLSDTVSIKKAAGEIANQTDSIDVLVNNAGISLDAHDNVINPEKVRKTVEVDLLAIIEFTDKLLPLLKSGSHIVNIDSTYGSFSLPIDYEGSAGYRIAKAGLNMYTRQMAYNLKDKGIIVSSLDPGWVKTDMGLDVADEYASPDREPEDPANDIFKLVNAVTETGQFWRMGQKREW